MRINTMYKNFTPKRGINMASGEKNRLLGFWMKCE